MHNEGFNKTTGRTIVEHVVEAKTWIEKAFGLLLSKKPYAMMFHTHFGIHTFGMRYPIDVLVLDKEGRVVKIKQNLQSNRIFLWNPKYKTIIELPALTISKTMTNVYDCLIYE